MIEVFQKCISGTVFWDGVRVVLGFMVLGILGKVLRKIVEGFFAMTNLKK